MDNQVLITLAIAVWGLQFIMLGWLLREVWKVKVTLVRITTALQIHLGAQWPAKED